MLVCTACVLRLRNSTDDDSDNGKDEVSLQWHNQTIHESNCVVDHVRGTTVTIQQQFHGTVINDTLAFEAGVYSFEYVCLVIVLYHFYYFIFSVLVTFFEFCY